VCPGPPEQYHAPHGQQSSTISASTNQPAATAVLQGLQGRAASPVHGDGDDTEPLSGHIQVCVCVCRVEGYCHPVPHTPRCAVPFLTLQSPALLSCVTPLPYCLSTAVGSFPVDASQATAHQGYECAGQGWETYYVACLSAVRTTTVGKFTEQRAPELLHRHTPPPFPVPRRPALPLLVGSS